LGFLEHYTAGPLKICKNAIDAMKGKGKLALQIEQEGASVK
jgi:hypothetical protein